MSGHSNRLYDDNVAILIPNNSIGDFRYTAKITVTI